MAHIIVRGGTVYEHSQTQGFKWVIWSNGSFGHSNGSSDHFLTFLVFPLVMGNMITSIPTPPPL